MREIAAQLQREAGGSAGHQAPSVISMKLVQVATNRVSTARFPKAAIRLFLAIVKVPRVIHSRRPVAKPTAFDKTAALPEITLEVLHGRSLPLNGDGGSQTGPISLISTTELANESTVATLRMWPRKSNDD